MKNFLLCIAVVCSALVYAQVPGTVYQRVQGVLGQKVLDSNNDGFISLTSAGFSGTDYSTNSELKMIALPVFEAEPINDLSTGSGGGHTDIASAGTNQSCYILKKSVDGIDYLIIRFRLGGASTASKGYSLLIDSDNTFGSALGTNNLGFDREIVYETGTNGRIAVYKHVLGNEGQLLASYNVNQYAQRSVGLSTVGGNADYFYDFFVPLAAVDATSLVRFTAVTVTSAGSGVLGTISDFNGVDDVKYNNNSLLLQQLLISSFPAVTFDALDGNFNPSSWLVKTATPTVNDGLITTSSAISGTSTEANGTTITIFKNGVSIGTTTVTNNAWTLSGISGLVVGDLITANALASGKSLSDLSQTKTVATTSIPSCFTPRPTSITVSNSGNIIATVTWAPPSGTIFTANSVRILVYKQTEVNTFVHTFASGGEFQYYPTGGGTMSYNLGGNGNFSGTLVVEAIWNGCSSGFSNTFKFNNSSLVTTGVTLAPSILTDPINVVVGAQNISVKNNHSANAVLTLYSNGTLIGTSSIISTGNNATFTISGLSNGDLITARAQGQVTGDNISNLSNQIIVGSTQQQVITQSPTITGSYSAGTNITIKGISTEPAGTEIKIYNNGVLIGTTTVTAFGTWEITGITLVSGNVLTATAKANSKSLSGLSPTVTVTAAAPAAPAIANEYTVESTSISGSNGNTAVQIYADGSLLGTTTPSSGNWSFTIPTEKRNEIYRGVEITAKNLVSGSLSASSNTKVVTGVGGFCITLENGNPLPNPINSGETYSIKITAIQGTTCPGTPYTGFTGTVNLSGSNFVSPEGTTLNFTSGELIMNLTFGGSGNTTLTAVNSADPVAKGTATTVIQNPALWVGTTSTDFNTASNWSGNYVPGPGAAVTFASNVMNNLNLDTNRLIGNLDFNNGAHAYKLVIGSNTLEIRGTITNSNIDKSITSVASSKLTLSGYGASEPVFFSTGSTIDELILNKTSSGSITVGSPVRVLSFLNVLQGSLNANGNITLVSTNDKTAVVPTVGGTITGNVTVENYIPAKRAFRFLTSTVNTSTSINANWQEGVINPNTTTNNNPSPGYGTHITGNGQNGLDATQTTNYSMYTYNNTTPAWAQVTNTLSNNLVAGTAYRMMIRGDRSINLNTNTPTPIPTTLRATGTLVVGDFVIPANTLNQEADTYSFIGNPYHAKVNMKEVLKGTGFTNQVWYWNPRIASRGAYVPVDFSNTTDVVAVAGAGNSRIVMPGASFFVKKQGTTSSAIVFKESHKVSETSNAALFRQNQTFTFNSIEKISISLHENNNVLPVDNVLDGVVLTFAANFNNEFSEEDMIKFSNLDEDLAVYHGEVRLSIDKRNIPVLSDVVNLGITKFRYSAYKFKINVEYYNGLTPYLVDQYLNTVTALTPGNNYEYAFTIDSQVSASISLNRFKIVFTNAVLHTDTFTSQVGLYPNPAKAGSSFYLTGATEASVNVFNLLGQNIPVQTQVIGQALQVTPSHTIAKGIYLVSITNLGNTQQVKWIVE